MRHSTKHDLNNKNAKFSHCPNAFGMAQLRRLIVGPEQAQLTELRVQLNKLDLKAEKINSEVVSKVLPEAIIKRSQKDKTFTKALMPVVEETIAVSVKNDPQPLADAIFPVLMPAIRKTISQLFARMTQSMNRTLEHSLSLKSLRWRLEAWRTGKSFAEVVLLHTLLYRVEQVLLIHRETGLLLQHLVAKGATTQDADIVSGMLTAIRDFVQDSFNVQKDETLDALQVGELTVWVEHGPQAILAGVIRGNAPEELKLVFQDALQAIHLEYRDVLESFQGDVTPFETSRRHLENCLLMQLESSGNKPSPLLWALLGILIFGLGFWAFSTFRENRRWSDYVNQLNAEPGIVVTATKKRGGKHIISGLRDPLSTDPAVILSKTKLEQKKVVSQWEAYQALSPKFILVRAKQLLQPPDTVTLKVENGVLYAAGTASHQWIAEARKLARVFFMTPFDERGLVDSDARGLVSYKEQIEKQVFGFIQGTAHLAPGQDDALQGLIAELQKIDELAQTLGKHVDIEIVGHASSDGSRKINEKLSKDRADLIRFALASKTLKATSLTAVNTDELLREEHTEQDRALNRSVSFRVNLSDAADGKVISP